MNNLVNAQELHKVAETFYNEENYSQAIATFEEIRKKYPRYKSNYIADVLSVAKLLEETTSVPRHWNENAQNLYQTAKQFEKEGNREKAITTFEEIRKTYAEYERVYIDLGNLLTVDELLQRTAK